MNTTSGDNTAQSGRILCFGGSFNPIHYGHLICARAVAEAGGFQHVVLIPSAQPPHKPGVTDLAAASHRVEMCRLAVHSNPLFSVNDLETKRDKPSYTLDTARELRKTGWTEVNWLIGGDMLAMLPQWHKAEELIQEVNFVIMARPGWAFDWKKLPAPFQKLQRHVIPAPQLEISASDIRARLKAGRSIEYLVPEPVRQYIAENQPYV